VYKGRGDPTRYYVFKCVYKKKKTLPQGKIDNASIRKEKDTGLLWGLFLETRGGGETFHFRRGVGNRRKLKK